MKKIINLSIMFIMFFSLFTLGSVSAAQSDTQEFNKKDIYDYNTLEKHYQEANIQALEYILKNNTIEDLDQFVTPEYQTYIKKYKTEVSVDIF